MNVDSSLFPVVFLVVPVLIMFALMFMGNKFPSKKLGTISFIIGVISCLIIFSTNNIYYIYGITLFGYTFGEMNNSQDS